MNEEDTFTYDCVRGPLPGQGFIAVWCKGHRIEVCIDPHKGEPADLALTICILIRQMSFGTGKTTPELLAMLAEQLDDVERHETPNGVIN